jgi:adenylate cyclase
VARISAQELADLVPCPLEDVRRLEELGILQPGAEDGLFEPASVHVVRLMASFEEAGVSVEDVARGVAAGELSFPLGLFMPEPAAMPETYAELGARVGRPPELLRRLSRELGLPPGEGDRVRTDDAEMLALVVTRLEQVGDEDLSRLARLYGAAIQRLVASGLQLFDQVVRRRVEAMDLPSEQKDALVYDYGARFTEVVSLLVPWLQRRHRERTILEYLVGLTEGFMDERGITPRQPRRPPAIAFLDLTGYTALAEERGDEAAAQLAADLAAAVQDAAQRHGGRAVKWLGDGVMFHFSDPEQAIVSSLDLVEQTERAVRVQARMGINAGAVIAQDGDYFGRTVNIAARIADFAGPSEVLVSDDARQIADCKEVEFELVGDVPLKGVSEPVRLHKAIRQS